MNLPDEIRQLIELGENGDSEACHVLGKWYALCSTLEENLFDKADQMHKARDWFYKALCDKDYENRAECSIRIAELYMQPRFGSVNPDEAFRWTEWANKVGNGTELALYHAVVQDARLYYENVHTILENMDKRHGGHRGEIERSRRYIETRVDVEWGTRNLRRHIYESGDPHACTYWAEAWMFDGLENYKDMPDLYEIFNIMSKLASTEEDATEEQLDAAALVLAINIYLSEQKIKDFEILDSEQGTALLNLMRERDNAKAAYYFGALIWKFHIEGQNLSELEVVSDTSKIQYQHQLYGYLAKFALDCFRKGADYGERHCLQLYSQYAPTLLGDTDEVKRYCGYADQLCQSLRYRYK